MNSNLTAAFFIIVLISGATDFFCGRIFNYVTLPAIGLGIFINGLQDGHPGFAGLEMSLVGGMVGCIPLYIVYRMGGMGAGDVKLMAGIGSLMGFPFVIWALFYSILVGGAMALIELIRKGSFRAGMIRTYRVFLGVVVPGLEPVPPDPFLTGKIPFGLAIALGSAWAWIDTYL